MWQEFIDRLSNINIMPFVLVFLTVFATLVFKYNRYQKVIVQLESYENIKVRINKGDKFFLFIIDSFKCTSCMKIFSPVKQIVEEAGGTFIALDSRTKQNFVSHSGVPTLIFFDNGKKLKQLEISNQTLKHDLVPYKNFVEEVRMEWKNS
ncbi:hypothetical protein NSQ26_08030 [Bacillus sp. FSL W7-1360]